MADPGKTPGETEMSWGPGLVPDPDKEPPNSYQNLKAASATNRHSDDPTYIEEVWGGKGE